MPSSIASSIYNVVESNCNLVLGMCDRYVRDSLSFYGHLACHIGMLCFLAEFPGCMPTSFPISGRRFRTCRTCPGAVIVLCERCRSTSLCALSCALSEGSLDPEDLSTLACNCSTPRRCSGCRTYLPRGMVSEASATLLAATLWFVLELQGVDAAPPV